MVADDSTPSQAAKQAPSIQRRGRKFDQVLEGASKLFMSQGFEATSVDDIAREASVSKATIYSYFPDKRLMFSEVVRTECQRQTEAAGEPVAPGSPPEKALYQIARQIMGTYISEVSQQMFRICVAEAARFPELGKLFYESGPLSVRAEVLAYLQEAQAAGQFTIDDLELAAEQFVELCKADLLLRAVFLHERDFSEEEQDRVARAAVGMFLARHRPNAPL